MIDGSYEDPGLHVLGAPVLPDETFNAAHVVNGGSSSAGEPVLREPSQAGPGGGFDRSRARSVDQAARASHP
jgi:hypothetical protein